MLIPSCLPRWSERSAKILSIGAYELLNSIEVPHQVVIDEAVNLAKMFGAEQGHSFINGVLDKAAKQWRDPASSLPFNQA